MKIRLERRTLTDKSTIGMLFVDDRLECYTLEDVVRPEKIAGVTAIPAGTYKVIINQSARFKRLLPLLIDVPGYAGIRIHPGNKAEDTEGCILVGDTVANNFIGSSVIAFNRLFAKMQAAKDGITITIS